MSDDKNNVTYGDEDIDRIECRLRGVELASAATESKIENVGRDIAEIKTFMQKWLSESSKIAEIAAKVESIPRLETSMASMLSRYGDLHDRFIIIEHSHRQCSQDRSTEKDQLSALLTRIGKVEGERLTILENQLKDLQGSKKHVTSIIGGWGEKIIFIIMLYLLYLIVTHFDINNKPGDMLQNPPKLKQESYEFVIPKTEKLDVNKI